MTTPRPLGVVAAALARRQLPVFPCLPGSKRPATRDGVKAATTDVDRVTRWWRANPRFNIGLATGDGLVVVDCDAGKPWPHDTPQPAGIHNGADTLVALAESYSAIGDGSWLCSTWSVRTPSGGMHYYYRLPDGVKVPNSAGRVGTWIDVRGDGGYVVAPWSTLPNGAYTPVHGWAAVDTGTDHPGPLDVPEWLLPLLLPKDTTTTRDPYDLLLARLDAPTSGTSDRYAAAALDRELDQVRAATPGTRNHALNRAAFSLGQLVAVGLLDQAPVTAALVAAAAVCGLDDDEARLTVASGLTSGQRTPRVVTLG